MLFPRRCVSCHLDGGWICKACQATVTKEAVPEIMPSEVVPAVVSLLDFEVPAVRKLIHLLKYGGIREAALVLMGLAKGSVSGDEVRGYFGSNVVLLPVPTSKVKRKSRGYNQASVMGESLGTWLDLPSEEGVLISVKNRQSQVGKGVADRLQVGKQFAIDQEKLGAIQGRSVVIVDDVFTTGGTVRACAELLIAQGIAVVGAIVMAHSRRTV